jgi:hypothetical protein
MKKAFTLFLVSILLCLWLAACGPSSAGPNVWIDQPLDGSVLPLRPVVIQAHGSDAQGVGKFEFFVGEQKFTEVTAGGSSFEQASVEWQPLAAGEYDLKVLALDGAGNRGAQAKAHVSIGEKVVQTSTPGLTPGSMTITPSPTLTSLPTTTTTAITPATGTSTATLTPQGCQLTLQMDANCRAGPSTVFEVRDILMQGENALGLGRSQDSGWFYVENPKSGKQCWLASSTVRVQCDVPALPVIQAPATVTASPSATLTQPVAPPDTQSPAISNLEANPQQIVVESQSCTNYSQTTTLSLRATDASGIAWVKLSWTIGAEQGDTTASDLGGGNYQATIGPVSTSGTLTIIILAQDTAGNQASQMITVNVLPCVG